MSELKEQLTKLLSQGDKKGLGKLVKANFPPFNIVVTEEIGSEIHSIIYNMHLVYFTLVELGFLTPALMPIEQYDLIEYVTRQLRSQRKTVDKFLKNKYEQGIYNEINIPSLDEWDDFIPQKLGGRIYIIPDIDFVLQLIRKTSEASGPEAELISVQQAIELCETDYRYIHQDHLHKYSYEEEWNNTQLEKLKSHISDLQKKEVELRNSIPFVRVSVSWDFERPEVLERLFALLSGKAIDAETTFDQFKDVFSGKPLTEITHKITWIDRLIPSTNRGEKTLTTLFFWLAEKELIPPIMGSDQDREKTLKTMKHCFINANGSPITRFASVDPRSNIKHQEFISELNKIL